MCLVVGIPVVRPRRGRGHRSRRRCRRRRDLRPPRGRAAQHEGARRRGADRDGVHVRARADRRPVRADRRADLPVHRARARRPLRRVASRPGSPRSLTPSPARTAGRRPIDASSATPPAPLRSSSGHDMNCTCSSCRDGVRALRPASSSAGAEFGVTARSAPTRAAVSDDADAGRHSGEWQTASTLLPSGSRTNAP